jgi:hypothetical protein
MEVIRLDGMPTSVRIDCDVCNNEPSFLDAFSDTITLELEGTCGSDAFDEITGITENKTSIVIERRTRLPRLPTVRAYKRERKGDRGKRRKARYGVTKTYLPNVRITPDISDDPVMRYAITACVSPEDLKW